METERVTATTTIDAAPEAVFAVLVPADIREYLQFPPFAQDHLDNSLQHLSTPRRLGATGSDAAIEPSNRPNSEAACPS